MPRNSFKPVHGHAARVGKSATYHTWASMIARCTRPGATSYDEYGAKGIKVCERWLTFENFLTDMGEKPRGQTLDRIDGNGNYEPSNCRWATRAQQSNNRKSCVMIEYQGRKQNLMQWSRELGIKYSVLQSRIKAGWSMQRAVETPARFK